MTDSELNDDVEDSCAELDDTQNDDSLVSSYDGEVAKHHECEDEDPDVRQANHMKKLNKFH